MKKKEIGPAEVAATPLPMDSNWIDVVDMIAARIKASGAEAVIALGGGSVMDAAKGHRCVSDMAKRRASLSALARRVDGDCPRC